MKSSAKLLFVLRRCGLQAKLNMADFTGDRLGLVGQHGLHVHQRVPTMFGHARMEPSIALIIRTAAVSFSMGWQS